MDTLIREPEATGRGVSLSSIIPYPINHLRGFMKNALKLLLDSSLQDAPGFKKILTLFRDLYEVTKRNHIYTPEGLFDRRRRAEICMNGLIQYEDFFSSNDFKDIMEALRYIRLENWTKQLQGNHGIIQNANLKKELYLTKIPPKFPISS